jgi:hypothetical protein
VWLQKEQGNARIELTLRRPGTFLGATINEKSKSHMGPEVVTKPLLLAAPTIEDLAERHPAVRVFTVADIDRIFVTSSIHATIRDHCRGSTRRPASSPHREKPWAVGHEIRPGCLKVAAYVESKRLADALVVVSLVCGRANASAARRGVPPPIWSGPRPQASPDASCARLASRKRRRAPGRKAKRRREAIETVGLQCSYSYNGWQFINGERHVAHAGGLVAVKRCAFASDRSTATHP